MGLNEFNPIPFGLFTEDMENISFESAKSSTHADKNGSETRVSELLGEYKADGHSGNLKVVGGQLASKSSKRKLETKDQSHYDSSCKRKFPTEKDLKCTGDKELYESHVGSQKRDLHKDLGFPAEDEAITICLPYIQYLCDQNRCSPGNTPVIRGKTSLKQMQLMAYRTVLKALYLQKTLKWKDEILLTDLRDLLHISNAEHAKALKCIMSIHY